MYRMPLDVRSGTAESALERPQKPVSRRGLLIAAIGGLSSAVGFHLTGALLDDREHCDVEERATPFEHLPDNAPLIGKLVRFTVPDYDLDKPVLRYLDVQVVPKTKKELCIVVNGIRYRVCEKLNGENATCAVKDIRKAGDDVKVDTSLGTALLSQMDVGYHALEIAQAKAREEIKLFVTARCKNVVLISNCKLSTWVRLELDA